MRMTTTISYCSLNVLLILVQVQSGLLECPPSKRSVERSLYDANIPGIAVVVVNATNILYEQGFGSTLPPINAENRPIDPRKSIFALGSISKTFITVAAMQLVESNRLDLDLDINQYLNPSLRVIHPLYPNHTITMRHVLSHTTSIGPNIEQELSYFSPNDDFTSGNLTEDVFSYIQNKSNWLPNPPGTVALYSNAGAGLAALIVEYIAHQSFEHYLHEHILQPLGIDQKQASYRLSDFQQRKTDLIEHYIFNSSWLSALRSFYPRLDFTQVSNTSNWIYLAPFGYGFYPVGLLRSSAHTLSIFLQSFLNHFPTLLSKSSSIDEMLRIGPNQMEDIQFGLIWTWQKFLGRRLVGHGGILPGVTNFMLANENRTLGVIVLSNGDVTVPDAQSLTIYQTLIRLTIELFDCFE